MMWCCRVMKNFCWGILLVSLMFMFNMSVNALTTWKYEDWQAGENYGSKVQKSSNVTNLKGEEVEQDGMKRGPFNKASKAKLSDGINEEVYIGLNLADYGNDELFEMSVAVNKKEDNKEEEEYLTEAVVMTQKSGDKFVLTAGWYKNGAPIATIDADGVYTYKWELKKENNKIKVKFTVLDYGKVLGTTDFVELSIDASKATSFRYLWACNIKANYGVDIYTTLPPKETENPKTADINVGLYLGLAAVSGLGFVYVKKYIF